MIYQFANLVAGNKVKANEMISTALTCKYMGWDWHTYNSQPYYFIQAIEIMRQSESEEIARENKKYVNRK